MKMFKLNDSGWVDLREICAVVRPEDQAEVILILKSGETLHVPFENGVTALRGAELIVSAIGKVSL